MAVSPSSSPPHLVDPSDNHRLPAIRRLAWLDGPPLEKTVQSTSAPSSSTKGAPQRPRPWPLVDDQRSKAEAPLSSSSLPAVAIASTPSSSSYSSSYSSASSLPSSAQEDTRQLLRPQLHPPPSSSDSCCLASQHHPFFDRGRKSLYLSSSPPPPQAEMDSKEESRVGTRVEDESHQLSDIEDALGTALKLLSGRRTTSGPLPTRALEEASRETSRALFLLQSLSAQNRRKQSSHLRDQVAGTRNDRASVHVSAQDKWQGESSSGAHRDVASEKRLHNSAEGGSGGFMSENVGRGWHLKWAPPPLDVEAQGPTREPRAIYEAYEQESSDLQPRPPTALVRVHAAPLSGSPPGSSSGRWQPAAEAEASYLYAPPSIRDRLATLHKEQQRALPPPIASRSSQTFSYSQDWDRAHYRPPPTITPVNRGELRWTTPTAPSAVSAWSPRTTEVAFDPRSRASVALLEYQHGQAQEGTGAVDDFGADHESGISKYKKRSRAPAPSACRNCGTSETPEWRRGPDGARTLCNACGLHFAKIAKRKSSAGDDAPEEGVARDTT